MSGPAVEIRLLGELAVRRHGQPADLPASRKTRALLGYLVATRRPVGRSHLCDLLWDGPVDPRSELRWSLSKLRALLGEAAGCLRADGDGLFFDSADLRVDLHLLQEATEGGLGGLSGQRLRDLEALFRGEFLAGLELPDCFRFDAWLTAERERLFALRVALLERQTGVLRGEPGQALAAARSWVALDPLSEAAHAAVVRGLLVLGRTREAHRQADTCRRILRQELGVEPGEVLRAACRRAPQGLQGTVSAPNDSSSPFDAPVHRRPGFLGRGREIGAAQAALARRVAQGSPRLLLVTGEPGIGKSRLLAELAERVAGAGGTALLARGFEAETARPYGVWSDLLRDGLPVDSASGPPPSAQGPLAEGAEPTYRERLLDSLAAVLAGPSSRRAPLLVVLDDLQWIDEGSIAILHALLERLAPVPVLFAAGLRDGELAPQGPAARLLRDLDRERALSRIPLAGLTASETAMLVRSVAPQADAERLAARAEGHPLFALELARSGSESEEGLPPTLGAVAGERLSRLGECARSLLGWAAALGGSFELDLLHRLSGLGHDALLQGIDELERAAVLRPDAGGERYTFVHDLVRRAAYEQIAAPRRRFLHAAIARAYQTQGALTGTDAGALSRHAALAGQSDLAARAALAAGEQALSLLAPAEAREHAERGLGHLAQLDEAETLELRLKLLRVLVHASQGRPEREGLPAEILRRVDLARGLGRLAEVRLGLYLLAVLHEEEGDLAAAERQVLRAAEEARKADPATAARSLANAGRCLVQIERDHARAETLLLEGRELAERAGIEVVDLPWGLGLLAQGAGRDEEARLELEQAVNLARAQGDSWAASQCLVRLGMLAVERRDHAEVVCRCQELEAVAARLGEGSEAAVAGSLRALAMRQTDPDPSAAESLEASLAALRAADAKGALAFALQRAAEIEFSEGRTAAAAERAGQALASAETVGRKGQIARARKLLAEIALSTGALAEARGQLRAALSLDRPLGTLGARLRHEIDALKRRLSIPTHFPTAKNEDPPQPGGEKP
jgi:DNA-binding SARP family transcriptional activator/predicted ATPase